MKSDDIGSEHTAQQLFALFQAAEYLNFRKGYMQEKPEIEVSTLSPQHFRDYQQLVIMMLSAAWANCWLTRRYEAHHFAWSSLPTFFFWDSVWNCGHNTLLL